MALLGAGKVQLEFRLQIEGLGYEFVTCPAMEQTMGDGRIRVAGLMRQGLSWSEQVSPAEATLECDGFTASIVDRQKDAAVTTALGNSPSVTNWLNANLAAAATTIVLMSNNGFAEGDVVHVGTEAILLGPVSGSTSFTGCTRAYRSTIAQKHYTDDGDRLLRAPVSNRPFSIEGRRARLFYYGNTSSLTGDGTQCFLGVCSTDASLSEDGTTWSISIDSITRLLDRDMGADLADTLKPRGIYFTSQNPFHMQLYESSTSGYQDHSLVVDVRIPGTTTYGETASATRMSGSTFYETMSEFCADVSDLVGTAKTSAGFQADTILLSKDPENDDSFIIWVVTDAANARRISGNVTINGTTYALAMFNPAGGGAVTIATSTVYHLLPIVSGGLTSFPSMPYGCFAPGLSDSLVPPTAGTPPPRNRIYLGGSFYFGTNWPLASSGVMVEWDGSTGTYDIDATNDAARYMELSQDLPQRQTWDGGSLPEFTLIRRYSSAGLYDFFTQLTTLSPTYASVGSVPFITTADVDLSDMYTELGIVYRYDWQSNREFSASEKQSLLDVITQEMRLIGLYPIVTSAGKISWRSLRAPSTTDVISTNFSSDNILVDQGFPTWERNGVFGQINTVRVKTGYSVSDGKWHGPSYAIRDQRSFSISKASRELTIAPMTTLLGNVAIPQDQLVDVAANIFAVLGGDYSIIRLDAPLHDGTTSFIDTTVGTFCTITSRHIPNVLTGTRGVTGIVGIIIGRRIQMDAGRVSFTILTSYRKHTGYAPCLAVTANAAAGGDYDLTVSKNAHVDSVIWMASGDSIADHFATGDEIKVERFNAATPMALAGTVVSVTPPSTIRVTFDGAWTPGAHSWILMYDDAANVDEGQREYNFLANGTTGLIGFATPQEAYEWG